MKKTLTLCIAINLSLYLAGQNVGISATGATPNASAILDLNTGNTGNAGVLLAQASLVSTTDVATITTPANGLVVYNTNAGMTNGNGVGYYYYCTSGCTTSGWQYMATPANSPGTSGQVLMSNGAGTQPTYTTLSTSGGGGSTGCSSCISQTAVGTTGTWSVCRNSCVAMGAGWRMPTWQEEEYIVSGALGTPTGGWLGGPVSYVWTSSVGNFMDAGNSVGSYGPNTWTVCNENTGTWTYEPNTSSYGCRCVK